MYHAYFSPEWYIHGRSAKLSAEVPGIDLNWAKEDSARNTHTKEEATLSAICTHIFYLLFWL